MVKLRRLHSSELSGRRAVWRLYVIAWRLYSMAPLCYGAFYSNFASVVSGLSPINNPRCLRSELEHTRALSNVFSTSSWERA